MNKYTSLNSCPIKNSVCYVFTLVIYTKQFKQSILLYYLNMIKILIKNIQIIYMNNKHKSSGWNQNKLNFFFLT
jgi:hypothetical protein